MQSTLPIHFAPLQGYTEAIYRQAHARIFGGVESYYTPFVRVEHGEIRKKDMREITLENNRGVQLIPQLIAPDVDKMEQIIALFIEKGYKNVDINLGCPFPLLAKRHNGSGMLPHPEEVRELLTAAIKNHPDLQFSVKMRLGWENPEECLATCGRFPQLAGIMIGRGLLANPALALEYQQGHPLSEKDMQERLRLFHADVFAQYGNLLEGGDKQLLTKMKNFWEYLMPDGDRKAKKAIHKSNKLETYQAAVRSLLG